MELHTLHNVHDQLSEYVKKNTHIARFCIFKC